MISISTWCFSFVSSIDFSNDVTASNNFAYIQTSLVLDFIDTSELILIWNWNNRI